MAIYKNNYLGLPEWGTSSWSCEHTGSKSGRSRSPWWGWCRGNRGSNRWPSRPSCNRRRECRWKLRSGLASASAAARGCARRCTRRASCRWWSRCSETSSLPGCSCRRPSSCRFSAQFSPPFLSLCNGSRGRCSRWPRPLRSPSRRLELKIVKLLFSSN